MLSALHWGDNMQTLKLPKSGQAMEEGTIVEWLVEEGEAVSEGDSVVLFETDKMTSEITANQDGRLLQRTVDEGETVTIGTVLGYVGTDAEEIPDSGVEAVGSEGEAVGADDRVAAGSTDESASGERLVRGSPKARRIAREHNLTVREVGESLDVDQVTPQHVEAYLEERRDRSATQILASPLARRTAEEEDVSLGAVGEYVGTDRLRVADVEAYLERSTDAETEAEPVETTVGGQVETPSTDDQPSPASREAIRQPPSVAEQLPIDGVRSAMYDRMSTVASEYGSTTTVVRVDVTSLLELDEQLSSSWESVHGITPSLTAFVVQAAATKLPEYRVLNAEIIDGERIDLYDDVNVGIAVNTDDGLLVPTVYHADRNTVRETSEEIRRLARAARDGELEYDELQNGTFTVSNAGSLGAYMNTPQINPPQTAILGVCTVFDEPGIVDGEVVPRKMMHLCLTYDHRVVEGATAVEFLQSVKDLLEEPESLLS